MYVVPRTDSAGRGSGRALAALALTALACLLTACGSGSSSSRSGSASSAKLTKAALIAKADAACATANAAASSVGREPKALVINNAVALRYIEQLKPIADKLRDDLSALVPPDSLKAAWTDYLSYIKLEADDLDSADSKLRAHDSGWLLDYDSGTGNGVLIVAKARNLGASTCAADIKRAA